VLSTRFDRLHRVVDSPPFDLPLENWSQLYNPTVAFQPDLVLELGRGYGNSTCVFTEAARDIGCRVVSIGFDSEHAWETRTAPRLLPVVGADWFRPLTVIQDDITTIEFGPLVEGSRRTLVYWDAHGSDVATAVIDRLLPALPLDNKIIVDDVSPAREEHVLPGHRAGPLRSEYEGDPRASGVSFRTRHHLRLRRPVGRALRVDRVKRAAAAMH